MLIKLLRIVLFPFSILYHLITAVRNYMYDKGWLKSYQFDTKTICVGNIRVGGTGKTPHVEYLIELLKGQYKIATLSRGYGRNTKGFILADDTVNATTIGDEPMQFYSKYSREVVVAVGEDRVVAIPNILDKREGVDLILLDDAYQHRSVKAHLNILLSEYYRPFYKDLLLPAGRLRESRNGASRADIIVITKCPMSLEISEMNRVTGEVLKYTDGSRPVFFTGIKYNAPQAVFSSFEIGRDIILVTGIANPDLLEKEIKKKYNLINHFNFKDHHNYTLSDLELIIKQFHETVGNDKSILLTEKDMVKWKNSEFESRLKGIPVFYLPVEIQFLRDKAKFDELIVQKLGEV